MGERPHACTCRPPPSSRRLCASHLCPHCTYPSTSPVLLRSSTLQQLLAIDQFHPLPLIISQNIYRLRVSCIVSPPLSKPRCLGARCRDSDVFALGYFVLSPHGSYLSCLAGSNSLSLSHTHTHTYTHSFVFFAVGSLLLTAFVSVPGAKTSMLPSHLCCRCVVATIVISS